MARREKSDNGIFANISAYKKHIHIWINFFSIKFLSIDNFSIFVLSYKSDKILLLWAISFICTYSTIGALLSSIKDYWRKNLIDIPALHKAHGIEVVFTATKNKA